MKKYIQKNLKIIIALIFLALFISYPLYNDNILWGHDITFHLVRIEGITSSLKELQIPVRIHMFENNGYGYATSIFYPELFLYIPAILRVFNVSKVLSYKILLLFINCCTVFSMYVSVSKITKSKKAGIVATLIYASASYRLEVTYIRAALGESLALAFFPIAIWGLYELCTGNKEKWYVFVIGVTLVLQSHILSLMFLGIVSAIFMIAYLKQIIREKRLKQILISLILIVLVNLWFITPFLDSYRLNLDVKNRNSKNSAYVFYKHAVVPVQLFNFFDTTDCLGVSKTLEEGISDEMVFSLGILCTLGFVISIYYCFKDRKKEETKFMKILLLVSFIFLISSTTIMPWKFLQNQSSQIDKICSTIQFPWRFLGIATVCISVLSGIVLGDVEEDYETKNYKIVIITSIIAFLFVPYFLEEYTKEPYFINDNTFLSSDTSVNCEYLIKGTDVSLLEKNKYRSSDENVKIISKSKEGSTVKFKFESKYDTGFVEIPLLYYPGYVAFDQNGNKYNVTGGNNNVVRIEFGSIRSGEVTVKYQEKLIYIISDFISILSVIFIIIYIIPKKMNVKIKK